MASTTTKPACTLPRKASDRSPMLTASGTFAPSNFSKSCMSGRVRLYFGLLNHWASIISSTASASAATSNGSQNSEPCRSFTT